MAEPVIDPVFHQRLGRALGEEFEVLRLLGRGGFADVYEIRERKLDRSLAIKVLRPEIAWGPWMVSRFEREARALASLNHLNIPPVHFVGDNEGLVYYVMPLIEGRSLGDILAEEGPIDPGALVDIVIPVLDALHHAHHLGIIHRDIKPDNIIIENETGRPLLVDFGVAKQVKPGPAGSSMPGVIMGTPGYISPEQSLGQNDVDARSDIYAIGATMYHLLSGMTIFPGEKPQDVLGQQLTTTSVMVHEVNPGVPVWLSAILARALAPNRRDRFQTAAEMTDAIKAGRRSGSLDAEARQSGLGQIREDDPTPRMVPAASGEIRSPWQRRSGSRSRRRRKTTSLWSWTPYLGLAAIAAAWFLMVPMTLSLRNNLLVPVEFSTEDGTIRSIAPGQELGLPMASSGRFVGRWFAVQPPIDSAQLGEAVSGVLRVNSLRALELLGRRVRRSIDSWSEGSIVFTPRVENTSSRPVLVTVGRTGGAAHCRCPVPPGETRMLGYYRLEPGSFVKVEGGRDRTALFANLESRIDLNTGILDLQVNDTILSRSRQ